MSHAGEEHRAVERVRACIASVRKLEQLSTEIDEVLAAKPAAIKSAENAYTSSLHSAEQARSYELSKITEGFTRIGEPTPPTIGNVLPKQHPVDAMRSKFLSIVESVLVERQRLKEQCRRTADTTPIIAVATAVWLIACAFNVMLWIGLVVPIGYFIYRGNIHSRCKETLEKQVAEFYAVAQALDEGGAYNLSVAKSWAAEQKEATLKNANELYEKRRHELQNEIDKTEADLRRELAVLDQGIVQGGWSDPAWKTWAPVAEVPKSLRLGNLVLAMPRYKANFPDRQQILIPALINYESGRGIVIEADRGLPEARGLAQSVVLRLLATVPPSGIRFTFIDPVSLGQNVAGFMSLEKYEPTLIGGKAWSDSLHIDKALAEITEHMETVIQKYLREDYKTIEEYNERARVKEAYRVVIVFDFPVNFTEQSAKRLVSIMRNGPRCGVFPVVIVDGSKPLPYGFNMNDLEQFATVFRASGEALSFTESHDNEDEDVDDDEEWNDDDDDDEWDDDD